MRAVEKNEGHEKMRFKQFSPRWVDPGSICVMIGKKGTGKSTLMLDICYALRHHPEVYLFQKTIDTNNMFYGIVPELFSFKLWNREHVKKIVERHVKENKKRLKNGIPMKYMTLIIDDQAGDEKFCKDPFLSDLFFNVRHHRINIIFTMQYSLKIHIDQRAQIDWVFMMRENIIGNKERLMQHYCGQFGSGKKGFGDFCKVFDRFTDRIGGCLVVKNTGTSNDITKNVFYYRSVMRNFNEDPSLPRWRMGSKAFWSFNARFYNPHWDSSSDSEAHSDEIVIERNKK